MFASPSETASFLVAVKRMTWWNLIDPTSIQEPAIAGIGCRITATYTIA
jgi:hypothetical protein